MRIPFIAGNWKMYKTVHEAVVFVKELRSLVKDIADVEIVVAPPFTAVHAAAEAARNTNIGVAAQNLYWEREGAFTGEVSPAMLKEAGAEYVIVGHSERRRLFHETDAIVNRKILAAIGGGSSQTAFGARGGATVLSKATAIGAALFMLGALTLAIMGQRGPGSIIS